MMLCTISQKRDVVFLVGLRPVARFQASENSGLGKQST